MTIKFVSFHCFGFVYCLQVTLDVISVRQQKKTSKQMALRLVPNELWQKPSHDDNKTSISNRQAVWQSNQKEIKKMEQKESLRVQFFFLFIPIDIKCQKSMRWMYSKAQCAWARFVYKNSTLQHRILKFACVSRLRAPNCFHNLFDCVVVVCVIHSIHYPRWCNARVVARPIVQQQQQ